MFNVTVLRMKDIIRILIGITLIVAVIFTISKNVKKDNTKEEKIAQKIETGINILSENSMVSSIERTIPTMANIEKENSETNQKEEKESIWEMLLSTQISAISGLKETKIAENDENKAETKNEEENKEEKDKENAEVQTAKTGLPTEVITNNPLKDNSNVQYRKYKN